MNIVSIVGARPQFIKCAPLSRELRKEHNEILVHTGQHYDYVMSKCFFDELEIPVPDYNLGIGSGSHGKQTGAMLAELERILERERPEAVVVYGDTNSTLAGALAASKMGISIAHVEAGLRSFDRTMPEEINRVLTDHVSDLLFVPTRAGAQNLRDEGITRGVHRAGDVMVDALNDARKSCSASEVLGTLGLEKLEYLVLTLHRAGNTGDPSKVVSVLKTAAKAKMPVVFPIHPRTRKLLAESGSMGRLPSNIMIIDPLGYVEMIALVSSARTLLTDSGGLQKESFILGTRCLTLRENTEWTETLVDGRNMLVGLNEGKIEEGISLPPLKRAPRVRPFGSIGASSRIAKAIGSLDI